MEMFEGFHLISIFALIIIGAFISIISKPGSSLFSWHPFFMSISFFMLIPISTKILKYRTKISFQTRRKVHWITQLISITLILGGFWAIYENKNRLKKLHFATNHGLSGLITVCAMFVQSFILGVPANWKLGSLSMMKFKKWHVGFSIISLLSAMVCLVFSFGTKFLEGKINYWIGCGAVVAVYGGLLVRSVQKVF